MYELENENDEIEIDLKELFFCIKTKNSGDSADNSSVCGNYWWNYKIPHYTKVFFYSTIICSV